MNDDGPTRRAEEALLGLLAETPFRDVRLAEVATRAGVPLADLRRAYEGPLDILSGFTRRIDVAVLEGDDPAMAGEPIKDRLLDALMRRYDLLAPHRPGLEGLARSARRDPVLAVHLARLLIGSQAWILEASGVSANGPYGAAKAAALSAALVRLAPTFFADAEAGLPKTMAALDAALDRLGRLAERTGRVRARCRSILSCCRPGKREAPATAEAAGEAVDPAI